MFKFNKKWHQDDVNDIVLVSLLLTLDIFLTFFHVFLLLSSSMYLFAELSHANVNILFQVKKSLVISKYV